MLKKIILFLFIFATINSECQVKALSAKSAVLYEPVTKRVIYSKNENEKLPMASTTKILTAITAIENTNLSDFAITSYEASVVEGSSIWLDEKEKMKIEDLLYGLLLSSGNDAAIVIAEHVSGSVEEFAKLMNNTAKKAGAKNSNFTNPSGLDDENHYTTAYDLAKITAYAMENQIFRKIVSTKSYTIPWENHKWGRSLKNHNKLLNLYEGAIGVKTGFTKKDGRCLVGAAERNGILLISVTLNAPDDWNDHITMFDYGFTVLTNKLIECNNYNISLSDGTKKYVTAKSEVSKQIPLTSDDKLEIKKTIPDVLTAPIKKGSVVGKEEIYINNKKIYEIPIITTEDVEVKFIPDFKFYIKKIYQLISLL